MNNSQILPKIAIIGAGASGLLCAERLSNYQAQIYVFEQMPSAMRKVLMAGKSGLNLSNNKSTSEFVAHYQGQWLQDLINGQLSFDNHPNNPPQSPADWVVAWCKDLGIETFVGSSGRIFPVVMKASPLVRTLLGRLNQAGVFIYYNHQCQQIKGNDVYLLDKKTNSTHQMQFDAIVLATGGGSYSKLGGNGAWQAWFDKEELNPLQSSNVGLCVAWSSHMNSFFGKPIKRVRVSWSKNISQNSVIGDVMISHYGVEGGAIYALGQGEGDYIYMDLLPDVDKDKLVQICNKNPKKSLATRLKSAGMDKVKSTVFWEYYHSAKFTYVSTEQLANLIKGLPIIITGTRPIDEAISTKGGVRYEALTPSLQLRSNPFVFCAGEMIDWDAPTGGYLLTACFMMGAYTAQSVVQFLGLVNK